MSIEPDQLKTRDKKETSSEYEKVNPREILLLHVLFDLRLRLPPATGLSRVNITQIESKVK
ncbi:MAG: hypothetical protein DMF70_08490 [Acidobacteria bacterium]|nr:MAG: hypothetical protein DMF70_08490 [Acidobacteriota bacterium]